MSNREPVWYSENAQEGQAGSRGDQLFGPRKVSASSYHSIAIVLAALIGAVGMTIAVRAYREWRARVAIAEVLRASNEAMKSVQLELAQQQRANAARQRVRQDQLDRQEAMKVEQIRLRQQTEEDARRAVMAEAGRREQA